MLMLSHRSSLLLVVLLCSLPPSLGHIISITLIILIVYLGWYISKSLYRCMFLYWQNCTKVNFGTKCFQCICGSVAIVHIYRQLAVKALISWMLFARGFSIESNYRSNWPFLFKWKKMRTFIPTNRMKKSTWIHWPIHHPHFKMEEIKVVPIWNQHQI